MRVRYIRNDGASQATKATTEYHHITFSGSGAKTSATNVTVRGQFTIAESATWIPGTSGLACGDIDLGHDHPAHRSDHHELQQRRRGPAPPSDVLDGLVCTGEWRNETFGSTGSFAATFDVGADGGNISLELGGAMSSAPRVAPWMLS